MYDSSDDESDNLSYDSDESDSTFKPSDGETFDTASSMSMSMSSNVASPEIQKIPDISGGLVMVEIKPERCASRNRSTSRCTTPVATSPYNLRSRSARSPLNNSIEQTENLIKLLEKTKKQTELASRIRKKENNNVPDRPNYYSSDDE